MENPSTPPSGNGRVPVLDGYGPLTDVSNSSTTMYLFTFLAAGVIVGGIVFMLILRGYMARRRYVEAVRTAIARGDTTMPRYENPFSAPARQGISGPRGPRLKPLPPMPTLWESTLELDDECAVGEKCEKTELRWTWFDPVSATHIQKYEPPPPPPTPQVPKLPSISEDFRVALRDLFPPCGRRRNRRSKSNYVEDKPLMGTPTVGAPPPPGSEVCIGVLIAMPNTGESWRVGEKTEEVEVPEVCFGVMECVVEEDVVVEVVEVAVVDKWMAQ